MKKKGPRKRNTTTSNTKTDKNSKTKSASSNSSSRISFVVAVAAAAIAYCLVVPRSLSASDQLMQDWPIGDFVEIQTIVGNNNNSSDAYRGLFATRDIPQGSVFATLRYPNLADQIAAAHPQLVELADQAVEQAIQTHDHPATTLTGRKLLSLIQFLREDAQGPASKWHSYIAFCPQNVSTVAWYWTPREWRCVLSDPRKNAFLKDLKVFHTAMDALLQQQFVPLSEVYNQQRAEWAYLMLRTRGFAEHLFPVMDLANHNPVKAAPAFIQAQAGAAHFVASRRIPAGEEVYNNYGTLSPLRTAEHYGFVESQDTVAYFEVPSIQKDMLESDLTKDKDVCTNGPFLFFGNVPKQVVGASYRNATLATVMKAYMPTERAYMCMRYLLQTETDTELAQYVAEKLAFDVQRFSGMAQAKSCQSPDGNFPLIRQANYVTAQLMKGALQVANEAQEGKIPYPGISSYRKKNKK